MIEIKFVDYKGHKILLQDFTNGGPGEEFLRAVEKAKKITRSQPAKSVLAIFDATGSKFNKDVVASLASLAKGNAPFIRASAIIGIEGMLSIALSTVSKMSGRSFKTFKDRESAMEWLIGQ